MRILVLFLILGLFLSSCQNDGMSHRSSYVISKANAAEIETIDSDSTELLED